MNRKNEQKRIVFIIGSMRKGGAERVISILANYLSRKNWKVDILLLLDSICEYELEETISLIHIGDENKNRIMQLPNWIYSIRKYVKENDPDRIVSFIARINIITIISTIGLKKKVIISERNDPASDGRSIWVTFGTYIFYPLANKIVFQTKWAKSCFRSKKIQRKSLIIGNPIHTTSEILSKTNKKIVSVGRLSEQKNHKLLINSFKKVKEIFPDYNLIIYGEGALRHQLENQIAQEKLEDSVFLPGNISDIHKTIADSKLFVLSSNYEGLSNALLEAMMMGLPVISTACAGSNEIIINDINGKLVDVGQTDELSNAIIEMLSDEVKAKRMGEAGKESVKSMTMESILSQWMNLIK